MDGLLSVWRPLEWSLLILLLSCSQCHALWCSICRRSSYYGMGPHVSDFDNLRIVHNLHRPYCKYFERIQCDRNQDVCVTEVINQKENGFMIAMGCEKSANYPPKKCVPSQAPQKQVTFDGKARRVVVENVRSTVCSCTTDECNHCSRLNYRYAVVLWIGLIFVRKVLWYR